MSRLTEEQKASIEQRLANGDSLRAMAAEFGVTFQSLQYHRRRAGGKPLRGARTSGAGHASWRGGSYVDRFGYRMVLAPERGKASKYVPEHILVTEKRLGRLLHDNETVHHIDCDPGNNAPENLHACTKAQHRTLHADLERAARELFHRGLIRWNGSTYEVL